MMKDLGPMGAVYPMPVLMVAAYDENGVVNVMNVAWGIMCGSDKVALCIGQGKKTYKNIEKTKAFTVALASEAYMKEADYFGIATGNKVPDKFERTGMKAVKSAHVNAPVIEGFPVVMECELLEFAETEHFKAVIGKIVNVAADEAVLDENGKIDTAKAGILAFNTFDLGYYRIGEKAGQAWGEGKELL